MKTEREIREIHNMVDSSCESFRRLLRNETDESKKAMYRAELRRFIAQSDILEEILYS